MSVIASYDNTNYDGGANMNGTSYKGVGQIFTADSPFVLTTASMYLYQVGTPAGTIALQILPVSGNLPNDINGLVYATSGSIAANTIGANPVDTTFTFPQTTLSPGKYALTLDYIGTSTNYLLAGLDSSTPSYAGGQFLYKPNSGSWATYNYDLIFTVNGNLLPVGGGNMLPLFLA